jgi:hypothetical protein
MATYLGAGFTPSQLSLLESGRCRPSAAQWARLDKLFGEAAATILDPVQELELAEVGDAQ